MNQVLTLIASVSLNGDSGAFFVFAFILTIRKISSMNIISICFILLICFHSLFSQSLKNYDGYRYDDQFGNLREVLDSRFDCSQGNPCLIPLRRDFNEYLDMKYNHHKKIIYRLDKLGYYYFAFNPKKGKETAFDLPVRVKFRSVVNAKLTVDIGIDTESQSGQVYVTSLGSAKPNWTYLLSETPTLSPVVNGEQILVCADHPVDGGKLYSLNAKTGKLDWFFLTPGAILTYPFVSGNNIIIIDDSGNIFWVDSESGLLKHKFAIEEFPVPNPILKDNVIYLAGKRGHLSAIRLSDARPVWRDLALIGDIAEMTFLKKGFIVSGGNRNWLFNYSNGAKQDIITGKE